MDVHLCEINIWDYHKHKENDSYFHQHRACRTVTEAVSQIKAHDAYVLYRVDFLYADHSSVANPGDSEPEWVRGDAAAFPDYIAGRELYGNNSYAQIRGGELAELNIE